MKANEWTRTHPCRLLLVLPLRLVVHQKVDEGSAEEGGNHRPNPRKYHRRQTGEDVTECTGGPQELSVADLSRSYETYCDPRLNYAQSLELALRIAQRLQGRRLTAS